MPALKNARTRTRRHAQAAVRRGEVHGSGAEGAARGEKGRGAVADQAEDVDGAGLGRAMRRHAADFVCGSEQRGLCADEEFEYGDMTERGSNMSCCIAFAVLSCLKNAGVQSKLVAQAVYVSVSDCLEKGMLIAAGKARLGFTGSRLSSECNLIWVSMRAVAYSAENSEHVFVFVLRVGLTLAHQ